MPKNGSEDKLEARTSEDSKFLLCGPRKNISCLCGPYIATM